ncbi:6333_t:CDS:10 [Racocetra fulgida]|uniref:6333_t:CDS:1 n=1 Tax=Racocetra fulgida TaxID=60492 RepID=A0A9N9EW54_9GLOM|nr:6333_t:CDS:10 [Racocetra fulgida]
MDDTSGEHVNDEAPDDSLTLGQLKKIVKQLPNKQKYLLETLELKDPEKRFLSAKKLLYIAQGDDSFGTELAELNPPMAVFLFEIVASLREKEKNAKGYPVKKSTPVDYYTFQNEATQKYPTYVPPPCPFIPTYPIAASLFPSANNHINGNESSGQNTSSVNCNGNSSQAPKSRKQQFQTNQRQPFIFPFSKSTPSVPKSIQEAGTFQCWKERIEMKKLPTVDIINNIYINENVKNQIANNHDESQIKITKTDKEKIERIEILYNSDNDKGGASANNDHIFENAINYSTSNGNTIEEIDIMRHREITSKAVFFQYCMSINNDANEIKQADNNMIIDNQQEYSQASYNIQSDQSNDPQSNTSNETDIDSDYYIAEIDQKEDPPNFIIGTIQIIGNMKVITSIYLSCRPDLRDEWISSTDVDAEMDDALAKLIPIYWQPQEQNLRTLIKFYNERNYFPQCDQQDGMYYDNSNRNLPDIFPPYHTKSLNHVNFAYIHDDIMLDDSFLENWEQWLQEEVYSFSVMKPHLKNIDEYYDDDFATAIPNGDGSEWDMPPTSPVDGKDPFSSIEWKNISSYELKAFEHRINSSGFKFFDFDDMETNNNVSATDADDKATETTYCWPDEMLGPLASSEVTIYQPTPYHSEDED